MTKSTDPVPRRINLLNIIKQKFLKKKTQSMSKKIVELVNEENAQKDKAIGKEEREILINAVNFTDKIVEDVMTPRSEIISISRKSSFAIIKKKFIETKKSRIPIYEDNLDNIIGYIHIKNILSYFDNSKKFKIDNLIKTTFFLPAAMKIADVALKMRDEKTRIAIVIDEYGGTDGLLTMDDIIEEIVGEEEYENIKNKGDGKYEVSAKSKIEDLEKQLSMNFKHQQYGDDFDSLGGLIVAFCNKIPKTGEIIKYNNDIKFHIKEAENRFIKKIVIEKINNSILDSNEVTY